MQKKNLFASALLCASMFLFTGCDKIMSHFDNSVDSNLKVADKLTIIGVGETYQIAKDVDYKTISDADPSFESLDKAIATVEPKTGLVTALKSGDARIKISLPDNGLYLDASAIISIKVRVHNTDEFNKNVKALADGDQILFAENAAVKVEKNIDFSGKNITILGVEDKPAVFDINGSFKITKGITIKNVIFNFTGNGNVTLLAVQELSEDAPKEVEGKAYFSFEPINCENLTFNSLNSCLIKGKGKIAFSEIYVNNCKIGMRENCNAGIFNLDGGYPKDLKVNNSTFWSKGAGHNGYLFTCSGKPADVSAEAIASFAVDNCIMYKIAVGKKANNGNNVRGKTCLHVSLTNSMLIGFGTGKFGSGSDITGNEINGWLFGQNSTNPTRVYNKNGYFNVDGTVVPGWTDSSKQGYDNSKTSITTMPTYEDPENGKF